jgi:hypothetical protein
MRRRPVALAICTVTLANGPSQLQRLRHPKQG